MTEVKRTILSALSQHRGDDLYRARAAFRNCTQAQMQEQYGQSGKTRAEIIAEYEMHNAKVDNAIRWLESTT